MGLFGYRPLCKMENNYTIRVRLTRGNSINIGDLVRIHPSVVERKVFPAMCSGDAIKSFQNYYNNQLTIDISQAFQPSVILKSKK